MKHYQDTETGQIYAFEEGVDVATLRNRNLPSSLSETVLDKPSPDHLWLSGKWIDKKLVPSGYVKPESSVPIYNPAWIAFLQPYTIVSASTETAQLATLDEINKNTYDNESLSLVVTTLPNYIQGSKSAILITRDGGVAIPRLNPTVFDNAQGAEDLNQVFCELLIGGVHAEVIGLQDICAGSLSDAKQIFCYSPNMHSRLRNKWAGLTETINLLHPRLIQPSKLQEAHKVGANVTNKIKNLTPFFLLAGYSSYSHGNARDALSSLWIVIEQLTSAVWDAKFLGNPDMHPSGMKYRLESLKKDHRTWTIAVKHEFFWQKNWIDDDFYSALAAARRARNELVHTGKPPDLSVVEDLWLPLCSLLEVASSTSDLPLRNLLIKRKMSNTTADKKSSLIDFSFWETLRHQL